MAAKVEQFTDVDELVGMVDLEDLDRLVQSDIGKKKADVANLVSMGLVGAVVFSPAVFLMGAWTLSTQDARLATFFDKWFAIVGPLAGAAVAFYFSERRAATDAVRATRRKVNNGKR